MERYVVKPSIELEYGIKVTKETDLTFKNENVEQEIKNLVLKSRTFINGEGYESIYDTTIQLNEGDILIFEEDKRGYIKPIEEFMTIDEAIQVLNDIK